MQDEIESARAIRIEPEKYAVHLPWRKYHGLAVSAYSIASVLGMTAQVAPEVEGTDADVVGLQELRRSFDGFTDLLRSKIGSRLAAAPLRAAGIALCIRPVQMTRTPDGKLCVVLHLDTIASYTSVAGGIVRELGAARAANAAALLDFLDRWYRDLKSVPTDEAGGSV